jgi:hypothetical protein
LPILGESYSILISQFEPPYKEKTNQAPDFRSVCHRSVPDGINTKDMERGEFAMCQDCCPVRDQ